MMDYKVLFRIPFTIYWVAWDLNLKLLFIVIKIWDGKGYTWREYR